MDPFAGLDTGFLVGGEDILVGAEGLAVEESGVQVQHPAGFEPEVGVAGEDPGSVLPGFERVAASQRRTVEADTEATTLRRAASVARSGHDHFASGTALVLGSSQANAFSSVTWTALNWRGSPVRDRSASPASRSRQKRRRHLRTESVHHELLDDEEVSDFCSLLLLSDRVLLAGEAEHTVPARLLTAMPH